MSLKSTAVQKLYLALNNEKFLPLANFLDNMTPTTLLVGDTTDKYYDYDDDYTFQGAAESWFAVDGIHPPTVPLLQMVDQATGLMTLVWVENGVLTVGTGG